MDSKEYWDRKIIEWEDSFEASAAVSPVERLAGRFRAPLKRRADLCLKIIEPFAAGASVLELGCGSGYFALHLFRAVGPRCIRGMDISPRAVQRAGWMAQELDLAEEITFTEGDAVAHSLPEADITMGLGFLDYLDPGEIRRLFAGLKSTRFIFTFSEKRISLLRYLHILYLRLQRCPKHFYYTKQQISTAIAGRYDDVKFVNDPAIWFGCVVHNFPVTDAESRRIREELWGRGLGARFRTPA